MKQKVITAAVMIMVMISAETMVYAKNQGWEKANTILVSMQSAAEDMIDAITAKDVKMIHTRYRQLKKEMETLNEYRMKQHRFNLLDESQSMNLSLANSWFALITLEMKEADDLPALANAVNQFTGELILLTHYQRNYEKDVAWMDYLGREIVLLNKNYPNDMSYLVSIRKTELQKTWGRIRIVLSKDNKNLPLIARVNSLMSNIMKSNNPESLARLGGKELDIVDEIEKKLAII